MKVLGIIAEYNPFHNGHIYHLKKSVKSVKPDYTVAVISGNFTQRGEPAVWDKWTRAKLAVKNGIDLVLEMPYVYACNSAKYFAAGGIGILNSLNCVTHVSFGSESGNIAELKKISDLMLEKSPEYENFVKQALSSGKSFPTANEEAVEHMLGISAAETVRKPNNILGIEYIKQLECQNSCILPVAVKRRGGGYLDTEVSGNMPGAAAVRRAISEGKNTEKMIPYDLNDIKSSPLMYADYKKTLFNIVSGLILTQDDTCLSDILSVDEGIENRLKYAVRKTGTLENLIDYLTGKRYTASRIRRMLMNIVTGVEKNLFYDSISEDIKPAYTRILAFSGKGAELLRKVKDGDPDIKLITNINKETDNEYLKNSLIKYDVRAADIYNILKGNDLYSNSEFLKTPQLLNG